MQATCMCASRAAQILLCRDITLAHDIHHIRNRASVVCLPPLAQGLLRLNTTSGVLEQLASRVHEDASPIAYANGLDIATDGSIYFTASTDIMPARSRDGSYDTGFAWVLNNFRGLPRWVNDLLSAPSLALQWSFCYGLIPATFRVVQGLKGGWECGC